MKTHELKQESDYFDQQKDKIKKFEIRKNDRDYQIGDILELKRYHSKLGYSRAVEIVCTDEITMEPVKGKTLKLCEEDEADTLKVKVTSIMTASEWNSPDAYIFADMHTTFSHSDLISISKVLKGYFQTDTLPDDYVILETEVIE